MTNSISDVNHIGEKPDFVIDRYALQMQHEAVEHLCRLEQMDVASPLDSRFMEEYLALLGSIDSYHHRVIGASDYTVSCTKGCSACCCHWVEDVNSFEGLIIAEHLKNHFPNEIKCIRAQCAEDCDELLRLESLVTEKLAQERETLIGKVAIPDSMDLLLSVFYQMRRPCPLLSNAGTCLVYQVRPLTCRMYVSVSDPVRCDPDYINDAAAVPTCILDLDEKANILLDTLHARFRHDEVDNTGLRSLLLQHIT